MVEMTADQMIERLDAYAGLSPDYPHWLSGGDGDPSELYCATCAEMEVAEGHADEIDGGWGPEDADYCCHCERCGVVLDYNLTAHGVARELEHFRANPVSSPLSKDDAFHIARVVEGAPDNAEVLRIAEGAIAAITYGHPAKETTT